MEALTFFSAMNRGQFREEQGIEGSSYCIFFAPMEELVTQDRMTGREDRSCWSCSTAMKCCPAPCG